MDDFKDRTVGHWRKSLPRWKQILFDISTRIVGDNRAITIFGYHHWKNRAR